MDSFKESIELIVSSIIGSFIGAAYRKNESTFTIITSIVAGIASSYYFTPAIIFLFGISQPLHNACAFLLGLLGMYIITTLIAVVENFRQNPMELVDILRDFFSKRSTTINNYNAKDDNSEPPIN